MGLHHWIRKRKNPLWITIVLLVLLLWLHRDRNSSEKPLTIWLWRSVVPHAVPWKNVTSFIAVKNTKTLLVSAYLEHREKPKQVRVIAVVLREEEVTYRCILHCQNQQYSVGHVSHLIHGDHFGFSYGTADIMCPLPADCDKPSHIAVVSDKISSDSGDSLRVTIPRTAQPDQHQFLEVKNKNEKNEDFKHNFTVCISAMFDFTNVLQFVQSLEMFKLLGVSKVFVYNSSHSDEMQRVLDYYNETAFLEVIPWPMSKFLNVSRGWLPSHDPGDIHYYGQIPALNDCLYRNMYLSKYVALHDIDEIILPQEVQSWTELLPLLEKKYPAKKCYMFENNLFPTNVFSQNFLEPSSQTRPEQDLWRNVTGVDILAHLHHEPVIKYENFKIIANPRMLKTVSVHGLLDSPNTDCAWVTETIARMYHTRAAKQLDLPREKLIYDGRLLSYSQPLIAAVNATLRKNKFL